MKVPLLIIFWVGSCWSFPTVDEASKCDPTECLITNNCRCSSTSNPINNPDDPAPLLIAITVSESIVHTNYPNYIQPLFFNKTNPDGNPRGYTFYVNHEYTNYSWVQELYLAGYEIGVHSITKNSSQEYWRNAALEQLQAEFSGQKTILVNFAGIPEEDIVGARTPQLQIEGDVTIQAYIDSGITYDNSWPATSNNRVLPYTLDYASTQQCTVTEKCPVETHSGFWIAPITNIKGADGLECNSLATCNVEGTADEIAQWLLGEVESVRNQNRAPLVIRLDSYWFEQTKNSFEGFSKFLNEVTDVFFVSVQDVLEWIKNPVPVSQYTTPLHDDRYAECLPVNCYYPGEDDGGQRGYTFYVNHEYTDYSLVQDLYLRGYEIGVHSITKNTSQEYWRNAPLEDLQAEFGGQKTILETFAGIPEEDIVGARTPQLQIEEDVTIQAYIDSGITYDNSWPATSNNRVLPYTLDYASTQQCTVAEKCPTESHPGFWIAPITNILGADGQECNSLATCNVEGTADEIAQWLIGQVDIVRGHNRAPLVIRLDSYWFEQTENSFDGFSKFLDQVTDVFFVSVQDVLEWIKNPVPASQYATPVHDDRYAECLPASCHYQGEERYMVSCVPCPPNYPWI
ncbi:hypothetical protein BDFB_004923, partial [Asbolus verrucosus]